MFQCVPCYILNFLILLFRTDLKVSVKVIFLVFYLYQSSVMLSALIQNFILGFFCF